MKRIFYLFLFLFIGTNFAYSQTHKVVFQLTTNDSKVWAGTIKNINHVIEALPDTQVELVCHSGGIQFILNKNTEDAKNIQALQAKGVKIVGCQNTLNGLNLTKDDLHPNIEVVPSGVAEVVLKQEAGWSYLRQTP